VNNPVNSLKALLQTLDEAGVAYCHWKSNDRLAAALAGDEDLDLLVGRGYRDLFDSILHSKGYKSATRTTPEPIAHFFGLDEARNKLVHIHVYYAIVTGGSLLKNYRLPVERALLENCRREMDVPIPSREIDLAIFVIRKLLEHASPLEFFLLKRESALVQQEIKWLAVGDTPARAARLASQLFPNVEEALFHRCCTALIQHGVSLRCVRPGLALARALRNYRIRTGIMPAWIRGTRFLKRILHRLLRRPSGMSLSHGGAVVAIVGADATGKSTVSAVLQEMLSQHLRVVSSHAGLPPASPLTFIPRTFLPLARRLVPTLRTTQLQEKVLRDSGRDTPPLGGVALWTFALRSLMVAYDRARLLQRLVSLAASGAIVVVDRYPTDIFGAMDSTQLDAMALQLKPGSLLFRLAAIENAIYRAMPAADVVVRLHVPVETAIHRNLERQKAGKEGESYVRRRHAQAERTYHARGTVISISTEGKVSDTLRLAMAAVWRAL
jgi:thymidylate kinase